MAKPVSDGPLLLLLAAIVLVVPTAAFAHAELMRSEPPDGAVLDRSPGRVATWFTTELETSTSSLTVSDAQGLPIGDAKGGVDLDDPDHASMIARLPSTLPAGKYTVRWSATSAAVGHEGHETSGTFTFQIR